MIKTKAQKKLLTSGDRRRNNVGKTARRKIRKIDQRLTGAERIERLG